MRRTFHRFLLVAAIAAGGSTLAGCKQSAGERCEIASDCSAGLICIAGNICAVADAPADAAPATDGRIATPDSTVSGVDAGGAEVVITAEVAAPVDVNVSVDGPAADASPDLKVDSAPVTGDASSGQ
jgi:hypothetical protein